MEAQKATVRQNYLAIVVAAIACFLFEAFWYSVFLQSWLTGIGRSMEWLKSGAGYNPALQFGTALVCEAGDCRHILRHATDRASNRLAWDQGGGIALAWFRAARVFDRGCV